MTAEKFNEIVENRLAQSREVLMIKNKGYSSVDDKLYQFKTAARIDNITPESALWGMYRKHLVSVMDIKNDPFRFSMDVIQEKIQDSINYMILLEALLTERNDIALNDD